MITVNGEEYATTAELAEMIGISKSRISYLRRLLPHFPRPARTLSGGDLYVWNEVQNFVAEWWRCKNFLHGDRHE